MKYFVIFRVTDDKGNFDEEDKIEMTQSDFNKAFESAWLHEKVE